MMQAYRTLICTVEDIEKGAEILLGYAGERGVTTIQIDIGGWLNTTNITSLSIVYKTPAGEVYPAEIGTDNSSYVAWWVNHAETEFAGVGEMQLVLLGNSVDGTGTVSKTVVGKTRVLPSIDQNASEPPDGYQSWMEAVLNAAGEITRVSATAITLGAGEEATASFNNNTGVLTIGVPTGPAPIRGKDYWTEEDVAAIKAYVDDAILNGSW